MSTRFGTLLAVILGSGIVFLDGTVVNVAVETIGKELPATFVGRVEGLTYVNNGYLAVLAALLILAGGISDFYGRRRMFRIGLAGFGAASVACGLAPNMELLILARLVQGAFGALLVPGSLSIITATFEGEERGRAIGLWAAGTSATMILGPFLGGFLVQSISWRAAFLINVPLVLIALYATTVVRESRDEEAEGRFDWLGATVIAVGVGGLAFGATRGAERNWQDALAFISLGIGVVATVAFPFLMRMRSNPLVPMSLFESRNFTIVNLSTFVIYGALYVTLIFQSLYLQGTLGYSPVAAGAISLPVGLLLTFLSTPAGQLAARIGPRLFLTVGPVIMGLGLLWLARIPSSSEPWVADLTAPATLIPPLDAVTDVILALIVFGLGIAILVAPLTTALMASVPVRRAGLGSAINNAISRVGAPLIGAVLFIAITASFYPFLAERVPDLTVEQARAGEIQPLASVPDGTDPVLAGAAVEASTDAFHLAMIVSALLLFAGGAINAVGIRNPERTDVGATAEATPVAG